MVFQTKISRVEMQEMLKGKDDYTKLDYLNRWLRAADNFDTKKFILMNLAVINEARTFYKDAAKNLDSAADMSLTYKEKIDIYLKELELLVKAGDFPIAEKILIKAIECGNSREKDLIRIKYVEFVKQNADQLDKQGKSRKAIEFYERLMAMDIGYNEKSQVKEKILKLYEKVGRIRDYNNLKSKEFKNPESNTRKINPGSFEDLGIDGF